MRFSVIVPVYKTEAYLHRCIDSILAQTCTDFELLLIDDASPDRCPEICDAYAERDGRIRVIHKEHAGLVAARCTGIECARGEYIAYVDSDDWVEPDLLERVEGALRAHNPDMVIFRVTACYRDWTDPRENRIAAGYYDKEMLKERVYPTMMHDSHSRPGKTDVRPYCWSKVYRSALLRDHYCRDDQITMGEDWAFVYECLYHARDVYVCDEALYNYNRLNYGSMTQTYREADFGNTCRVMRYLRGRLGGIGRELDEQMDNVQVQMVMRDVVTLCRTNSRKEAYRKLKEAMDRTRLYAGIHIHRRNFVLKRLIYVAFLKRRCYALVVAGTRMWIALDRRKGE